MWNSRKCCYCSVGFFSYFFVLRPPASSEDGVMSDVSSTFEVFRCQSLSRLLISSVRDSREEEKPCTAVTVARRRKRGEWLWWQIQKASGVKNLRNHNLCQSCIFAGNIFICHQMQSDSPVVHEEIENDTDWFLSANVMYKIGESALYPDLHSIFL